MGKGKKNKKGKSSKALAAAKVDSWSALLRPPNPVDLTAIDARSTPGFNGDKTAGKQSLADLEPQLDELQECLYANGRAGGERRLLLVVQGMDTSGKGGTMRHVVGRMDPQGVRIKAFKAPTAEEKRRGFLWRIRQALPEIGEVGVFDRSHYEDVLVARVRKLASAATIERRYSAINDFEASLVNSGYAIVKVMLHISKDEQKARLQERLDNPEKHWKYNPGDVDEREFWDDYQRAYKVAIDRCNTDVAPWHVVPADRKWYRNLAVANLIVEQLKAMDLSWPKATYDVKLEKKRLAASS